MPEYTSLPPIKIKSDARNNANLLALATCSRCGVAVASEHIHSGWHDTEDHAWDVLNGALGEAARSVDGLRTAMAEVDRRAGRALRSLDRLAEAFWPDDDDEYDDLHEPTRPMPVLPEGAFVVPAFPDLDPTRLMVRPMRNVAPRVGDKIRSTDVPAAPAIKVHVDGHAIYNALRSSTAPGSNEARTAGYFLGSQGTVSLAGSDVEATAYLPVDVPRPGRSLEEAAQAVRDTFNDLERERLGATFREALAAEALPGSIIRSRPAKAGRPAPIPEPRYIREQEAAASRARLADALTHRSEPGSGLDS